MLSVLVPEVVVVVMETVHSECLIVESCPSDVGVVVTFVPGVVVVENHSDSDAITGGVVVGDASSLVVLI